MKRKLVLIVPVAAVTLWANSFGFISNAASVDLLQGQNGQPNAAWASQQQDKEGKQVAPNQQNKQQVKPVAPTKEGQPTVDKNKKQTVTQADKEKRRVALANDYENRKKLEKPPVEKEAPKPPKKANKKNDTKKPIPPKEDKSAFFVNA
ncbi:MAG: hypothetical protein SOY76_07870 [Veillonella caviae]|nr:hypothetical protein [Veillonella caviae]